MKVLVIFASIYLMLFGCLAPNPQLRDFAKEEECFAQEKIYYKEADKCYKLLTKGPCSKGEWFVLEKPMDSLSEEQLRIAGKCMKENCMDGEYYWPESKSCVKPQDKGKLCSDEEKEELQYNLFGEGECFCTRQPPSGRLYNKIGNSCHILYTQGPCQSGEVLGIRDSKRIPVCISDRCHNASIKLKGLGKLSPQGILAPWTNNTCYELGTQGPCPEGMSFKIHSIYKIPSCLSLINHVFDISRKCYQDERGKCQQVVTYREDVRNVMRQAYIDAKMRRLARQKESSEIHQLDETGNAVGSQLKNILSGYKYPAQGKKMATMR